MQWIIFRDRETGSELFAYTVQGTFSGELEETANLLAHEKGKERDEITISVENR